MGNSTELFLSLSETLWFCPQLTRGAPAGHYTVSPVGQCIRQSSSRCGARAHLLGLLSCALPCKALAAVGAPCATRDDTLGTSWEESGLPLPSGLSLPSPRDMRVWGNGYIYMHGCVPWLSIETITTLFIGSCLATGELFGSPLERSTVSVKRLPSSWVRLCWDSQAPRRSPSIALCIRPAITRAEEHNPVLLLTCGEVLLLTAACCCPGINHPAGGWGPPMPCPNRPISCGHSFSIAAQDAISLIK